MYRIINVVELCDGKKEGKLGCSDYLKPEIRIIYMHENSCRVCIARRAEEEEEEEEEEEKEEKEEEEKKKEEKEKVEEEERRRKKKQQQQEG